MSVTIKGTPEFRARLKAIQTVFKPIGREWADTTAQVAQTLVPVRTGTLKRSIRRKNATLKKATVSANFTAFFVDAGTKRHTIVPKKAGTLVFPAGGRTVFAKKVDHPATHPQPFRQRAADEGMRRTDMADEIIKLWNSAKAAS